MNNRKEMRAKREELQKQSEPILTRKEKRFKERKAKKKSKIRSSIPKNQEGKMNNGNTIRQQKL